jgi:hypothetical protein
MIHERRNTAALQDASENSTRGIAVTFWSAAVLRRFGIACHSTTGTKSSLTLNPSVLNR